MTVDGHTLYFTYDASGTPLALDYDGHKFYYITNLQGDVISIVNGNGTEFVRYTYDAWGNVTTDGSATNLRFYNPLRYRGYVYDEETGLYYLQSRYYNPEIGRFINGDGFTSTGQGVLGNNMFAYCGNNPVIYTDKHGNLYEKDAGFGGGFGGFSGGGGTAWSGSGVYQNGYVGVTIPGMVFITDTTRTGFQTDPLPYTPEDTKEVYSYSKQVARALQYLPNFTKKNAPEVHHIVPKKQFTNRNKATQQQITEMHAHLSAAEIDRYT